MSPNCRRSDEIAIGRTIRSPVSAGTVTADDIQTKSELILNEDDAELVVGYDVLDCIPPRIYVFHLIGEEIRYETGTPQPAVKFLHLRHDGGHPVREPERGRARLWCPLAHHQQARSSSATKARARNRNRRRVRLLAAAGPVAGGVARLLRSSERDHRRGKSRRREVDPDAARASMATAVR